MKIGVIDNFDYFVFNLVRYLRESSNAEVIVQRNNNIDYEVLDTCDMLLLSPGPGIPEEAGELINVIKKYSGKKKILGICLGNQAISEVFGAKLEQCNTPLHGKSSIVNHFLEDSLFKDISKEFQVGRYHSWKVNNEIPEDLETIAVSEEQDIMAIRHKDFDVKGIQFHPESILTPQGRKIIENWINDIYCLLYTSPSPRD